METVDTKLVHLQQILTDLGSVVVAYSGGIDSTLMLKLAHDWLAERAVGVTAVSASLASAERQEAEDLARHIGARHVLIQSHETEDERYLANSPQRCYFCKTDVYGRLVEYAAAHGFTCVVDGTNADDVGDHRPGRQAAREHGVRSPLLEAGITKDEIRTLARRLGLPNWDKPAAACLSSRIPYGTAISIPMLSQVEQAEWRLRQMGFRQLRVRHHGPVARLEIEPADFTAVLARRDEIASAVKACGYTFVALDLDGFRSGSMNETLLTGKK